MDNNNLQNQAIKIAFESYLVGTSVAQQAVHKYEQLNELVKKDQSERYRLKVNR